MKRAIIWLWNALRGYGFDWIVTPGSPAGGYIEARPGTCPYPLSSDWSVKRCIADGNCGCDEKDKR